MSDSAMQSIISALAARYGREPTEDEVYDLVTGDAHTQNYIWNKEVQNDRQS